MKPIVRILYLEDNLKDAERIRSSLVEADLSCRIDIARTQDEFEKAISGYETDIILANHQLPLYDGLSAMQLAKEMQPDIPFIFVSDVPGEEVVVEAMTRGAADYVLKQNLSRLAPAVRRALGEARIKKEQKQTERQNTLMNFAMDKVRKAAFLIDEQSRFCLVNEGACRSLGYSREELLCLTVSDINPDLPANRWPDHWRELKEQGALNFESHHMTKDGRIFPVEVSANYFEYKKESYNLALVRDITEQREAEKRLKASELRYRSLVENLPDFIARFDTRLHLLYVNPSVTHAFNIPLEPLIGKRLAELPTRGLSIHVESLEKKIREAIDTGNVNRLEAEWPTSEGDRCVEIIHIPEKDEKGAIVSVLGVTRDITERKIAERERASHLDFFKNMDRINRAIQGAENLEQMMRDVLDTVLSIFDCDRAFLMYPCDPCSATWSSPMERNKPEYPGAFKLNIQIPMDNQVAETLRILLAADGPVEFGPGTSHALPAEISNRFSIKCFMSMAIYPKSVNAWQFGIHQCSYARIWTPEEKRLFQEIGRRISDGLTGLLAYRDLKENESINLARLRLIQFASVHSLDELLEETLNEAEKLTGSFIGFYHFVSNDQTSLTLQNWSTRTKSKFCNAKGKGEHYPIDEAGVWVDCVRQRKPWVHNDYASLPNRKGLPEGHAEITRELVVPVFRGKKIKAILGVGNKPADYTKKDVETISLLANLAWEITERKQADEKMLRSEQRLRFHSEQSPLGFLEWDDNFHAVEWNAACEQIFGYTREEAIGRHAKDLILPIEAHDLVEGIFESLMNQTDGRHNINENITKDGRIIICEWFNTTLTDKEGKAIGIASVCTDITERKKAEEALALKNRINEILLAFPGKRMYWEVLQVILELTKSPYGYFGYLDEEGALVLPTIAEKVWEVCQIPGKDIVFPRETWANAQWHKVITKKKSIYANAPLTVPEGHIPIQRALGVPILYQEEVIGHFLVANRETDYDDRDKELLEGIADLISPTLYSRLQTEREEKLRKRSEAEIKHLKNHLANIINSMPSMLVGIDKNEIITQWNRQVEKATGIPVAEAVGKPVKQMFPDLSSHIEAMMDEIKQQRTAVMEKLPIEKEEERRLYDLMLYPLLTNGTEGAVLRIEDVTEQTRIQNLIIQTEKMMSLGGLAAGMAHEINNPLGIITQAAQNLERRIFSNLEANVQMAEETGVNLDKVKAYFEKRQVPKFIDSIREASKRASRIIENILKFSRGTDSAIQSVSIVSIIEQALELAAGDYDLKKKYDFKSIEIVRDYEPDLPMVPIFAVEMEQVMLNLLKNSAQAVKALPSDRKPRIILRLKREERYILIEIADNGHGMDENIRLRVFEPFFTTKEPGIGTGLGLSVAYMIVTQNHRGLMEVDSTPGKGTCFRVRLPLMKQ